MTLIKIAKSIAEGAERSASGSDGEGNAVAAACACCIKTCLSCIEEIVDMLSRASFSYMSITGEPYCTSGKNGFLLFFKHLVSLAAVFFVTGSVQFIGTVTCTSVAVVICSVVAFAITQNSYVTLVVCCIVFFLTMFSAN